MSKTIESCRPSIKTLLCIVSVACVLFVLSKELRINLPKMKRLLPLKFVKSPKSIPKIRVKEISCAKLFKKDREEQEKALRMTSYRGPTLPLKRFADINCKSFVSERGYITNPLTSEEESFPIAFSIPVFKDIGQVERLLRAIYRPQNAYCFHADKKSPKEFREGLERLASCFPNVIMSSRSVNVHWGRWTNLECDLICMEDLLKRFHKWKYLINLTGQEFPLRTNLELVRILKTFNGSNNMEATTINPGRAPKKGPDFPVKWTKGSVHIIVVRKFVEFVFHNEKAIKIANLLKPMPHPDETLFSTLNYNKNLKAPGGYKGNYKTDGKYKFLARLKNWGGIPCESGRRVRGICIWGIKDLPLIDASPYLFINKLYWNFQPFALDCLEERIFNNTRRDHFGQTPLKLDFYKLG